ncbi:30S ribosomal protein S19 [bacterium]|nr:30S ribosomal protein S19 [bacterium]
MSRSIKKGPYVHPGIFNKVEQLNETGDRQVIRVYKRACVITPEFLGHNFEIYNGKKWVPLFVTEDHIGHRFGEFAPTRNFRSHSKDERKAKR